MCKISFRSKVLKLLNRVSFRFFILIGYFISYINIFVKRDERFSVGFIVEEFFHQKLRGFGGFGMTVKNITDYFNLNGSYFKGNVIIPQGLPIAVEPMIKKFHNAKVLLRPVSDNQSILDFLKYIRFIKHILSCKI